MGPKRRKSGKPVASGHGSKTTRSRTKQEDEVPEIYREMLAEAERNPVPMPTSEASEQPAKRRKLDRGSSKGMGLRTTLPSAKPNSEDIAPSRLASADTELQLSPNAQTIFDDFADSDDGSDDESDDEEFEDIDLAADHPSTNDPPSPSGPLELDLSIAIEPHGKSAPRRRKPATPAERKMRLDVHKWHLLCLLMHLQKRNHWCDDEKVQAALKSLVPLKFKKLLHLDASESQLQRSHSFRVAVEKVSKIWLAEWRKTEAGMRRAHWTDEEVDLEDLDSVSDPVDMDDFREAANTRTGSRDLGAQLFCALLRSIAVETRLVASLQALPFSGVAKGPTPQKPKPQYAVMYGAPTQNGAGNNKTESYSTPGSRLYSPDPQRQSVSGERPKKIKDSPYPIFWVEVFDAALQKWISVDPIVRKTFYKPKTGFEPPASDSLNRMSYVVAFEDDGSAVDVTRRYAASFNGKTRRDRVESSRGGEQWWRRTMAFFEKPFLEDRDDIESAEFVARETNEPMPKNIQDFKHHPHYALERHLRRNEVIHPRREVGKVSVGSGKGAKLEPVFRRGDVLVVKTSDQWYRVGRDVIEGEQPLKHAVLRRRRGLSADGPDLFIEEGLYFTLHTRRNFTCHRRLWRVESPRNAYGNLDVYVQSMIPAGAIHVQHPDAARASRILGVDYVDAVTGFKFSGRQGTAVIEGIVAAAEYRDSLVAVIEGIEYERASQNALKRADIALQMWRKFLIALRIRERTNAQYGEDAAQGPENQVENSQQRGLDSPSSDGEGGGGFLPEADSSPEPTPRAVDTFVEDNIALERAAVDLDVPIVIRDSVHSLMNESPPFDTSLAHLQLASISEPPPYPDTVDGGQEADSNFLTDLEGEKELAQRTVPPSVSLINQGADRGSAGPVPDETRLESTVLNLLEESAKETATEEPAESVLPVQPVAAEQNPSPTSTSSLSKGSLLSHDPEDSDAEPEWIVDMLGAG